MNYDIPASSDVIRENINIAISAWHWNDDVGPIKAAVCLVCDRFITSNGKNFISLQNLNNIRHWFYETPMNSRLSSDGSFMLPQLSSNIIATCKMYTISKDNVTFLQQWKPTRIHKM
jgi:hypothetical protein